MIDASPKMRTDLTSAVGSSLLAFSYSKQGHRKASRVDEYGAENRNRMD